MQVCSFSDWLNRASSTNSASFSRRAYEVAALCHALSAVNTGGRSQISRPTKDMENLVAAVGYL